MGDNVCCPYFVVANCAETSEHKHIVCLGSLTNNPGIDNEMAIKWCLGDYENCPMRPKGEE